MNRLKLILCAYAIVACATASTGLAQNRANQQPDVPRTLSYQGTLATNDGKALADGEYTITARFYSDAAGQHEVWKGVYTTAVRNGVFNLALGSEGSLGNSPLPSASIMSAPVWTGIQIENAPELRPLTALSATPYALTVANGAITKAKMGTDYVGSLSINGQKISERGADINFVTGDGVSASVEPGTGNVMLSSDQTVSHLKHGQINANTVVTGTLTVSGLTTLNGGLVLAGGITLASLGQGIVRSSSIGALSSSALVSADIPNNAANTSGSASSFTGSLSGDVTGTQSATSISANAVTTAKILDGTIVDADVSPTAAIAYSKLAGTPTSLPPNGAAGGDLTGTYPNPTLVTTGVTAGTYGGATQSPTLTVDANGRVTSASNTTVTGVTPGGSAGGDLSGTYPNPTIATGSVTSAKILDGTIVDVDVSPTAAIAYSKLSGTPTSLPPNGAAAGDLTGTYPNPTLATSGVTAGSYTSANITVDAKGRVTLAANGPADWGLAGNAGTTYGTNFIGTTDAHDLQFRVHNTVSGMIQETGNAVGPNTGLGFGVLANNTTGGRNIALGWKALNANTTGRWNTATGYALTLNTTGDENNASGDRALNFNTTGINNSATGSDALLTNTTGNDNTAFGRAALTANTTGSNNTALGSGANVGSAALTNATAIGSGAVVGGSNSIQLGNTSVTLVTTSGAYNTTTGYRVSGAAASGHYLRGNGTNYADGTIQAADVPTLNQNTTGSAASFTGNLAGDVTGTQSATTLATSGVTAGSYTTANITVDAKGRVTAASNGTATVSGIIMDHAMGNTAVGELNLTHVTTGGANAAFGTEALEQNTTGTENTATGYAALNLNTTGGSNVGMGVYALYHNTTATGNTAVGHWALKANTIGSNNAGFGQDAMGFNTTGSNNTALGGGASFTNTTAGSNTAVGAYTLYYSTGSSNTGIGVNALLTNTTGASNTALGANADVASAALTNATAIGSGAVVGASNSIQLGNTSVTKVNTSGAYNTTTGYQVSGAAPSGHFLRGDATNYVDGTIAAGDLPNTSVTAGSYTNANITVDAQGRITAASNGGGFAAPIGQHGSSGRSTIAAGAGINADMQSANFENTAIGSHHGPVTEATVVQVGTSAERPSAPEEGMIRFNKTTKHFEGYNGTKWRVLDVGAE